MKKFLTAILAAALALSLFSGCAGTKSEPTETTAPAATVDGTMDEAKAAILAAYTEVMG